MKWSAKATTNTVTTITAGSKVQLLTPTPGNEFITVENIVADSILTNAFQAKDAGLTSISGLTTAADKMIYTTALDTYAVADLSAFARTLLDDTDATSVRATIGVDASGTDNSTDVTLVTTTADYLSITGQAITLGLVDLSTDVTGSLATGTVPWSQLTSVPSTFAPDAHTLDSHSNVTITANSAGEILKWDGSAWVNNTLAEAGIDPAGTDNSTDVTLAGTLDYITLVGQVLTRNAVDLSTDVTGSLATGTVPWSQLTSVPSTFTPSAHNHASSEITSGTFADARIAASNVTQHQASIIIASSQISDKGSASGVASLDGTGKIPSSQLPALAITSVYTAVSEIAHLALTTQEGDVVVRTDENKSYIHNGGVAGTMADWQLLNTPTDTVLSVNGYTGSVTLSKSDVSLGSVENTALSTWAGTSSITTLGTIGTGTWQGGVVQPTYGGTGLTSISTLLNSNVTPATLGLVIGTNVQAYNARLSSIAGLTPASSLIIGNGLGGYEMVTPANFITNNNILDTGDIGVAVQAYNATLASVAGGTYTGDDSIVTIGTLSSGAVPASLVTAGTFPSGAYVFQGAVSGITTLGASGLGTFGIAQVGNWATVGTIAIFGHSSFNTATGYGVLQNSSGATFLNSASGQSLTLSIGGTTALSIDSSRVLTVAGSSIFSNPVTMNSTLATGALTVTGAMSATTTISAPRINGSTGTGTLLLYGDSAATIPLTISDTGAVSTTGNITATQNFWGDGTRQGYLTYSVGNSSVIVGSNSAHNLEFRRNNIKVGTWASTGLTVDGTLASGALTVTGTGTINGNISLSGNGTGSRYVALMSETSTYAGSLVFQAGGGSAGFGGGIRLYGHSHATLAGDVVAGISSSSGGSFRVNGWGVDGGTDYFEVNTGTGATTVTGTLGVSSYLQGTTTNGFLQLRGDSGATSGITVYDTGAVTSGGDITISNTAPSLIIQDSDTSGVAFDAAILFKDSAGTTRFQQNMYGGGKVRFNLLNSDAMEFWTNNILRYQISSAGAHNFQAGSITTTGTLASGALTVTGASILNGAVSGITTLSVTGNSTVKDLKLTNATSSIDVGTSTNATTVLDFDFPDISTATGAIRVFRNTNTSGTRDFTIYKGDGTGTSVFSVSAASSTVATGALTVTGTGSFSGNVTLAKTATSGLVFDNLDNADVPGVEWRNADGTRTLTLGILSEAKATYARKDMVFKVKGVADWTTPATEVFRLASTGATVTGTLGVSNVVTITSASDQNAFTVFRGAEQQARIYVDANGAVLGLGDNAVDKITLDGRNGYGSFSSYLQGTTTNGYLDLRGDSGATRGVRIQDNGYVGVGTSSPFTVLTVETASNANGAVINAIGTAPNYIFDVRDDGTSKFRVDGLSSVIIGSAAIATTATDGFLYIPSCAGAPTGVPTTYTGRTPMVFDTTNNKLMIYDGGWIGVTLA